MALKNTADGQLLQTNVNLWNLNTRGYTVACWARLDTASDWRALWGFEVDTGTYDIFYIRTQSGQTPSNGCGLYTDYSSSTSSPAIAALTAGTWYYLAVTRPPGGAQTAAIYAWALGSNTVTTATGTTGSGTPGTPNYFTILDDNYFTGENSSSTMAHLKVWDVALSQAEILRERYAFAPQRTGDLQIWLPLTNLQSARQDLSGNNRVFTVTGTPALDPGPPIQFIDVPSGYSRFGTSQILLPMMHGAELHIAPDAGAGGDITQALSGEAATASAGTLTPSHAGALSGQSATASAGTLSPAHSQALAGEAVTASAGTLVGSKTIALPGQAVTASAGTLGAEHTQALSGQEVTASAGTITYTAGVAIALIGQAVTAEVGILSVGHSQALTGQAATAATGTINYSGGSTLNVALTGQEVISAAGTLVPSHSQDLAGQTISANAGTLTPAHSQALVGQAVAASAGTVTYSSLTDITLALTGTTVTTGTGILGLDRSLGLTGHAVTVSAGSVTYGLGLFTDAEIAYIIAKIKEDPMIMTVPKYLGFWQDF